MTKAKVLSWLERKRVDSIHVLNQCRLSLGVLRVRSGQWQGVAVPRETSTESEEQKTLFEDLTADARGDQFESMIDMVRFAPYIHFEDAVGHHQLQIREWGAYLLLAQSEYASNPEALWKAPGYRSEKDLYLIVGNMNNHRKNWLVIKTFEADAPDGPNLFDGLSDDQAN